MLKGIGSTFAISLTMRTIMPKISRRAKVFSQRLLTSLLLLPKLSKAPFCSTIIAGNSSENIMAIIMPGTMKRSIPIAVKIPATN